MSSTRLAVVALVALTLTKGLVWVGVVPVWKNADEPAHFDNLQYRAEHLAAPRPTGEPIDKVVSPTASHELRESWKATQKYWRDKYLKQQRVVAEETLLRLLAHVDDGRDTH